MDSCLVESFHKEYIKAYESNLDALLSKFTPKSLIKFFPALFLTDGTNYSLNGIKNKTLWLSSPKKFNDPFDSVVNIGYKKELWDKAYDVLYELVGEVKAKEMLSSQFAQEALNGAENNLFSDLSQRNTEIEQSVYVSCFSEVENLNSVRMWSHYANSHAGFCAEYDFNDIKTVSDFGCIPVKYTDKYLLDDKGKTKEEAVRFLLNLVFTKSYEWKYEREWRIVTMPNESYDEGYNVDFAFPKKIYLGCKSNQNLIEPLSSFCKENEIELYKMKLKRGTFQLEYNRMV